MEVFVVRTAILLAVIGSLCLSTSGLCQDKPKPEMRGMWVTAWDDALLTPAGIDETINLAKKANLNALFVQVRKAGDALYKSSYEPKAENLPDPNFDALAYIIKRAHASGIEVHAWLNTYKVWQGTKRPKSPDHVFNKHPEWINRNDKGLLDKSGSYGLDPGIKEVQEYTAKIYLDVVKKYDVDGIHFDYCRYWDPWFGYSDLAVERYKKETGAKETPFYNDPQWCQWRRDRVTAFVGQVYAEVKALKPWVKVTSAVVVGAPACPEQFKDSHPYKMLLQEWERWTREGIVDAVLPMNYKPSEADAKEFSAWTAAMVKWAHKRYAFNGISARADTMPKQVKECREKGTAGAVGFAFNGRSRSSLADALREQVYQEWVPVPAMPWKTARKSGGPIVTQDPKELYDLGIASASANDYDTAIILLKRAIDKDMNFKDAYYRLGRCYLRKGMKTEAANQFKQVLELDPSNKEAQDELRKIAS